MRAQPVLILKPNGDVAIPLDPTDLIPIAKNASLLSILAAQALQPQAADLLPLAKEATLADLGTRLMDLQNWVISLGTAISEYVRPCSLSQIITADLSVAHGNGAGLHGLIPTDVYQVKRITVIAAPPAGAVSLFLGPVVGDSWAVPAKTGDIFDDLFFGSQLNVEYSNTAAPGASLVLLVQGW